MRILRFVLGSILGVAILVGVVFGLIILGRLVFSSPVAQSPVCEEANVASLPPVIPQANVYHCNAVMIGGPVATEGSCSWCTINYSYPGEVYIVASEPMKYKAGAWVFQYQNPEGDIDAYTACMNAQPFIADVKYTAVWPKD